MKRRQSNPPATNPEKWPVKLNVRGEAGSARIRAGLERAGVRFQFEALPHNDFQYRVQREDRDALKAARRYATEQFYAQQDGSASAASTENT